MSTKSKPARASGQPKAKPVIVMPNPALPEPGQAQTFELPSRRSESHMKNIGGSGLALWDESLLSRTMQTLRPPALRQDETVEQHNTEIACSAGTALAAFRPKDAVEAMIASQAVALHFASLECARRAMLPEQSSEVASRLRKDAANSARAMVDMTEALERRRGKGPQVIRVEKMMVADGGQAVVGSVTTGVALSTSGSAPRSIGQGVPLAAALNEVPAEAGEGEGP